MEVSSAVEQLDQVKRIQRVVRIINMVAAGTGVGLILTFLIMNAQLILGNGLGIAFVPKLEGTELLIIMFLNLIIILAIIVILGIFVMIIDGGDDSTPVPAASPSSPEEAAPRQAPVGGARSM